MTTAESNQQENPDELLRSTGPVGWSRGLGTIARIVQYSLQTPWLVVTALISTVIAALLQLMIPVLLGRAIDQTQHLVTDGSGVEGAKTALLTTAIFVLAVWILRGVFTTLQNYFGESVGHHTGYLMRLAYYEKIQNQTNQAGGKEHPYTFQI